MEEALKSDSLCESTSRHIVSRPSVSDDNDVKSLESMAVLTGSSLDTAKDGSPTQELQLLPEHQQENMQTLRSSITSNHLDAPAPAEKSPAPTDVADHSVSLSAHANLTTPPQDNMDPKCEASASAPSIKSIVQIVLAAVKVKSNPSSRSARQGVERNALPNGKIQCHNSAEVSSVAASDASSILGDRETSPKSGNMLMHSKPRKDALTLEVHKALNDLGCMPSLDTSRTPRALNAGSVASNKSEKKVLCDKCKKFQGRPCELK